MSMVPPKGFFPRYLKYAMELTDAPDAFHIAAALAVHSAICSNFVEVYFPTRIKGSGDIDPTNLNDPNIRVAWSPIHLWTLIVGPSGDRKGTAVKLALDCGKPIVTDQIVGVSTSPEATFDIVGHHPDAFFVYAEGASLFSMFNASYWQHGQGLFPQLYDGDDMKKQLAGQRTKKNPHPDPIEINIPRPRVSMLVGVAPSHLDAARSTDWTGGLIGRMVMVYGERDRYEPVAGRQNDAEMVILRGMLSNLRNNLVNQPVGVLKIGMKSEAGVLYMDWARQVDGAMKTKSPKIRSLYNRLPQHILRVAAHYALSQNYSVIDRDSVEAAINFGNYVSESIDRVGEMLTDDRILRNVVRLREFLDGYPAQFIPLREVMKALGLSAFTLKPAIESLQAAGQIRCAQSAKTGEKWLLKGSPAQAPPSSS
jgi:hypothetical protein